MSAVGLEGLEHTVQLTHVWINELNDRLAWNDKSRSYRLLKAVLHAVRDRLSVDDSAHLAAQLPTLLRGVFYEQWRPAAVPNKRRALNEFIEDVGTSFKVDRPEKSERRSDGSAQGDRAQGHGRRDRQGASRDARGDPQLLAGALWGVGGGGAMIATHSLSISPEKVCFIVMKAHQFDVKDVVTDPDSSSNAADDAMLSVLEDHPDDPTYRELRAFIGMLSEDEQIDLVALDLARPRRRHARRMGRLARGGRAPAQQAHRGLSARQADARRSSGRRTGAVRMLVRGFLTRRGC